MKTWLPKVRTYPIVEYCRHKGLPVHKEDNRGNYRLLQVPATSKISSSGLIIKDNYFFSFSEEKKGDIITFAELLYDLSFREAVLDILSCMNNESLVTTPISGNEEKNISKKTFKMPLKTNKEDRSIEYLIKTRNIPLTAKIKDIIRELIYEDNRGNIVFLCKDIEQDNIESAIIRSMSTSFKGLSEGSNTDCPFAIQLGSGTITSLYIFEAPIDLISYIALQNLPPEGLFIAMGGLRLGTVEKLLFKRKLETLQLIYCMTDSDRPGIQFFLQLKHKYKNRYQLIRKVPPTGKDWNEYIQLRHIQHK